MKHDRILLVDDDDDVRAVCQVGLEHHGFDWLDTTILSTPGTYKEPCGCSKPVIV
jgi:CheY-like chemotaxis protein